MRFRLPTTKRQAHKNGTSNLPREEVLKRMEAYLNKYGIDRPPEDVLDDLKRYIKKKKSDVPPEVILERMEVFNDTWKDDVIAIFEENIKAFARFGIMTEQELRDLASQELNIPFPAPDVAT